MSWPRKRTDKEIDALLNKHKKKTLIVDLDLLVKQGNLIAMLQSDLSDDHFKERNTELLTGVLDMLCDIQVYLRENGEILLKEKD